MSYITFSSFLFLLHISSDLLAACLTSHPYIRALWSIL